LFHANRTDHAWNSGGAGCVYVGDGWRHRIDAIDFRGTDDIDDLFHAHNG